MQIITANQNKKNNFNLTLLITQNDNFKFNNNYLTLLQKAS